MKSTYAILSVFAAILFGAGCVAIPMGKEIYTTEYAADIKATSDAPTKTYEPAVTVADGDNDHLTATIALKAKITSQQPQEQQYKTVTVEKHKRLAVGLFPMSAQRTFHSKGSLEPIGGNYSYSGEGKYFTSNHGYPGSGSQGGGIILNTISFGLVSTPISMLAEIFGPYEKDLHFLGGAVDSKSTTRAGNTVTTSTTYASEDIDLLRKFPMSEREKIGAWTYHENETHPHNTFWHGFETQWFGVHKYCNYFVKDGTSVSRSTPAAPEIRTSGRTVSGPYMATLTLPALDYQETVAVEPGATEAKFNLLDAANGDATASGTIRYALPAEGEAAVRNADDREILKLAGKRELPVTVMLPTPRAERVAAPEATPVMAESAPAAYRVASIERLEPSGLVVRVAVDDTARTVEIDREVQPEIRRMFREQFATGENANKREKLSMELADGGKMVVYTVVFE